MPSTPYASQQWRDLRPAIYDRDAGMCQACETPHPVPGDEYDIDHIIPWQEGGAWYDPTNLRLSCWKRNRGRGMARMQLAAKINRAPATSPSREW